MSAPAAPPTPRERLTALAEIAVFLAAAHWIDLQLPGLGLAVDPQRLDPARLMLATLVRVPAQFALILALLRLRGGSLGQIGLRRCGASLLRIVVVGLVAVPVIQAAAFLTALALHAAGLAANTSMFVIAGAADQLAFLVVVVVGAGFGEELVYRGFLLERFTRACATPRHSILGRSFGTALGPALGAVASSLVFALAHGYQGPAGMIGVFVIGLVLCAFVRLCRGMLWPAMVAHAVYDEIALLML